MAKGTHELVLWQPQDVHELKETLLPQLDSGEVEVLQVLPAASPSAAFLLLRRKAPRTGVVL